MNDDLISRKSLIENLNKFAPEHYNALVNDLIAKEPTAFDKEKVIEELRSEASRWHESGVEFKDENEKGVAAGFRLATHIVEKGGIE